MSCDLVCLPLLHHCKLKNHQLNHHKLGTVYNLKPDWNPSSVGVPSLSICPPFQPSLYLPHKWKWVWKLRKTLSMINTGCGKLICKMSALGRHFVNVYIYRCKMEGLLRCLVVWFELLKLVWYTWGWGSSSWVAWWYGVFHIRNEFWFQKLLRMNFDIRNHGFFWCIMS